MNEPHTVGRARKKHRQKARESLKLLPPSQSLLFCKDTYEEQAKFRVVDKLKTGGERNLPSNEILVMALNEIAVLRGHGFFLHLRNRDCWKKVPESAALCPPERRVPRPR